MSNRMVMSILVPSLLAASAFGQATLYMTPLGTDITPDGSTLTGELFDLNAGSYWAHVFNRDTRSHVYYTDREVEGELMCNRDATVLAAGMYDLENLAGFGDNRQISHVRPAGGNWTNIGPGPGGFRCDFIVNSPSAIARNTNELLINGWTASLCGPFRSWIYNPSSQTFTQLPFSVSGPPFNQPSFNSKAGGLSDNGDAACGWDENWNANFTTRVRKATAWRKVGGTWSRAVLDAAGGDAMAISGNGNVIIGYMNPATMQSTFGTSTQYAVRWSWNGSAWVAQNLGGASNTRAFWVSSDGGTVVGDTFFWRADINGGVAMDLGEFLTSQGLDLHGMEIGAPGGSLTQGLSGDGNSLIIQLVDHRDSCLTNFRRAVVDLNGRPCSAPLEILPPPSQNVVGELGLPANHYYGVIINMYAAGTADMSYQWQKLVGGEWTDLNDDGCDQFDPHFFDVKGSHGSQLRLGQASGEGSFVGSYRCVVTNPCGMIVSTPAEITGTVPCPADFNGDGFLDFFDYDDYVACFETGNCPPGKTADFNGDGFADFFDYDDFVSGFETGC